MSLTEAARNAWYHIDDQDCDFTQHVHKARALKVITRDKEFRILAVMHKVHAAGLIHEELCQGISVSINVCMCLERVFQNTGLFVVQAMLKDWKASRAALAAFASKICAESHDSARCSIG